MTLTPSASPGGAFVITQANGEPPAPFLPKDALGMTLLVVCAAMALDILAPWSESYSVRQSLVSRFGHPAFVVVALALIAALPLYRPQWRRSPLCAAAPLAVGALSVGVGLTYYIFLARENSQALNALNAPTDPSFAVTQTPSGTPISPQLGLYLFILIGVVLAVVGYQLFLAAVRSQYVIITAPLPLPLPQPYGVVQVAAPALVAPPAPPMVAQTNGSGGSPSPASIPLTPVPLTLASAPPPAPAPVGPAPSQPAASVMPSTPVAAPVVQAAPAPALSSANGASRRGGLVLPGTDAWNEEPVSPVVNKQSRMRGGWRYSSR